MLNFGASKPRVRGGPGPPGPPPGSAPDFGNLYQLHNARRNLIHSCYDISQFT